MRIDGGEDRSRIFDDGIEMLVAIKDGPLKRHVNRRYTTDPLYPYESCDEATEHKRYLEELIHNPGNSLCSRIELPTTSVYDACLRKDCRTSDAVCPKLTNNCRCDVPALR